MVKNPPAMQEMQEVWVGSLGQEGPLEGDMVTHFSMLAWEIPWTEEPIYSRWDHKDSDMTEHDDSTRKEQSKTLGCELDQSVVRPVNFIWGLLCSKL